MKQLYILATMLIINASCRKQEDVTPTVANIETTTLVDSTGYYNGCQVVIFRSYHVRVNGVLKNIIDTREVLGNPCGTESKPINNN